MGLPHPEVQQRFFGFVLAAVAGVERVGVDVVIQIIDGFELLAVVGEVLPIVFGVLGQSEKALLSRVLHILLFDEGFEFPLEVDWVVVLPLDALVEVLFHNETAVFFFQLLAVAGEILLLFGDEVLDFGTIGLGDHVEAMVHHLLFGRGLQELVLDGFELFLVEHDQGQEELVRGRLGEFGFSAVEQLSEEEVLANDSWIGEKLFEKVGLIECVGCDGMGVGFEVA